MITAIVPAPEIVSYENVRDAPPTGIAEPHVSCLLVAVCRVNSIFNDVLGQNISWKAHHKHLCKLYNQFIASEAWQALDPHQRTDSILLSHCAIPLSTSYVETDEYQSGVRDLDLIAASPVGASFDLMRSSREDPLPYIMLPGRSDYSDMLGGWFGSNNFLLHSHLNPAYSHGIYILASRTLNHSCVPNAAPRFVLEEGKTPRMDVVALTTIKKGHEVRKNGDIQL